MRDKRLRLYLGEQAENVLALWQEGAPDSPLIQRDDAPREERRKHRITDTEQPAGAPMPAGDQQP